MKKDIKQHFHKIIIFFLSLILLISFSSCDSIINNRPVWPCIHNQRFKYIYIKEADGKYTSQSLFDIYSFTHISHGIIFFYILSKLNHHFNFNQIYLIYFAILLETSWELIENSEFIINKYRKNSNVSRNYKGDSIINSIGDIFSMIIGYIITYYYPQYGIYLLIINEFMLYYLIKDNLFLNILQILQ